MMMITDQMLTCTSTYTCNNDDYAAAADYRSNVNMHFNIHMMMIMLLMMITVQMLTCTSTYTRNNDDYADYRSNVNMHIDT